MFSGHLLVLYLRSLKKKTQKTSFISPRERALGQYAQIEHSGARGAACVTVQPGSAAAGAPGQPGLCQGGLRGLARCAKESAPRKPSSRNVVRGEGSKEQAVCVCVCECTCYLRPRGMLHIWGRWARCPVKEEEERVLAKATQRTREQGPGSRRPIHMLTLSVAPCLFPLRHFRCSQQLLLDLGPRSNLQQPHPLPSAGAGPASPHPHSPPPAAPRAPVGVGSANANSFKCQLEQHEARKANR